MVGGVVITHGSFAEGLLDSVEMIVGKNDNLIAINLQREHDLDVFSKEIENAIEKVNNGHGVVVFVDLYGATPFNTTANMINSNNLKDVKLITGVNLPMVLEFVLNRSNKSTTINNLTELTINSGKDSMQKIEI